MPPAPKRARMANRPTVLPVRSEESSGIICCCTGGGIGGRVLGNQARLACEALGPGRAPRRTQVEQSSRTLQSDPAPNLQLWLDMLLPSLPRGNSGKAQTAAQKGR